MKDADCVALLQWALPRLGLRWAGFRKVRRRACKRVSRRMRELGLADARVYRERLEADPAERRALERIADRLQPGGALVIGMHEQLPAPAEGFEPWPGCRAVYRRTA